MYIYSSKQILINGLIPLTIANTFNSIKKLRRYKKIINFLNLYGSLLLCYYTRKTFILFNLAYIWFNSTLYKILNEKKIKKIKYKMIL